MKILTLIPARGGSKGIPGKNIKPLNGKPLIWYTLEVAAQISKKEDICVSTDDNDIIKCVEEFGITVPFIRPKQLASDEAGMNEVLLHAIDFYKKKNIYYDAILLLQPTSPLRNAEHVREALSQFNLSIDLLVSVNKASANPYYNLFEENKEGFLEKSKPGKYVRRQDVPVVYEYNGAIYIYNINCFQDPSNVKFNKIRKYLMSEDQSIDIDSELDWIICGHLLVKMNNSEL